ncbi:ATPO synthase, partial [Melanocharis versteri]|nr:ATPO synthase [Melanocharis versteri]
QVRQLSTTAARPVSKLVKPPIQVYGLEGRYATALYSAASKQKKLEQVEKELTRVWVRCSTARAPAGGLGSSGSRQQGVGEKTNLSRLLLHSVIEVLAVRAMRTSHLCQTEQIAAERGLISSSSCLSFSFSSVLFFQPLDEASLTELKSALNGFLAKGEVLKLETKTDPSILGGMIVNIGEKYVDMSTRSKIQKLTKIMRETV